MSPALGGGSVTALPIIETMNGNISAYIPTNVISITDGQIYLEEELFHSGIRPAVNTGLSVSRVGRSAQCEAMKRVSGTLRIELSKFREMAVFSRFGSDVDVSTAKMLKRGQILTQLFKQKKTKPLSVFEQTVILLAYKISVYDDLDIAKLDSFVEKMLRYVKENNAVLLSLINSTGKLSEDQEEELKSSITAFKERTYE